MSKEAPPFPSPTKRWHNTAQPAGDPAQNPALNFKNKSILITGGGSTGIGGETARWFAAAGASRIGLLGRRLEPLEENKAWIETKFPETEVFIQSTDVTVKESVDAAFANFASAGKKIDTLIHAAAVVGPKENVLDVNDDEFFKGINTNLQGSLYVARAFVRHAAPDAHVVAINSWGAHLSLNDAFASYCVGKMAVYRLWDLVQLSAPNISVFHTQPGVVITEMNLSVGGAESFKDIKTDDGESDPIIPVLISRCTSFAMLTLCVFSQCLCQRASTFGSRVQRPVSLRGSSCGVIGTSRNSRLAPRRLNQALNSISMSLAGRGQPSRGAIRGHM